MPNLLARGGDRWQTRLPEAMVMGMLTIGVVVFVLTRLPLLSVRRAIYLQDEMTGVDVEPGQTVWGDGTLPGRRRETRTTSR